MREKCLLIPAVLVTATTVAACGGGEVTVQVLRPGSEGALLPVEDLPVEFLPYDRDSIFEALAARAPEPEPRIPDDLRSAFDSVSALQDRWREAESRWAEGRDSLKQLSDRLNRMDRRSREYAELYQRWTALERRVGALDRQRQTAFTRFDDLQKRTLARADSMRAVITSWEDVAFQDYGAIVDSILKARGREVYADTTNAEGYVRRRLPGGDWWVHARLPVPFAELYWNVHIRPGEVDTLRLTPENVTERRIRL